VTRNIFTKSAPAPIGPYTPAVRAGKLVYCSGQTPLDPATGELVEGDIAVQTRRVMENIKGLLDAAGLTFKDVVKTTVYLTNMGDFAAFNAVYGEYFQSDPPARTTVGVAALPRGASVEIEAIARS
jgi:2-iminobutanoate/2-iminopropanoate deaminase